jgi:hexosaminidase
MRKFSGLFSGTKRAAESSRRSGVRKKSISLLLTVAMLMSSVGIFSTGVATAAPIKPQNVIIPKPASISVSDGTFQLSRTSEIFVFADDADDFEAVNGVANYLKEQLTPATGWLLPVNASGEDYASGDIILRTISEDELLAEGVDYTEARGIDGYAAEGYHLEVGPAGMFVTAYEPEGLFRGVQTIRQLFPAAIESETLVADAIWDVMYTSITDYPRYGYRGVMLDVARKWFPKEEILRQIDLLAQYKINVVRLHLTEDQGFRIAMDGYPELTEIGPHMKDVSQGSYNGANVTGNQSRLIPGSIHYGITPGQLSKADFKEILAYADERYMTIIPEIEFPSHNYAMQVALPMLLETGQLPDVALSGNAAFWTDMVGQAKSVNPTGTSKAAKYTKAFIEDVFTQMSDMLHGRHQYIHVGGDESHTQAVEDFYDVTKLAIETVEKNGKISMQWAMTSARSYDHYWADVFQSWNTGNNGVNDAARPLAAGKKVLVSTANQLYLDHFTTNDMPMGHSWAARAGVPVSTVFNTNPEDRIPAEYRNQGKVIGVEGPVWAETNGTQQMLDLLVYPRAAALAEIGWSPDEVRSGTGEGSAWA